MRTLFQKVIILEGPLARFFVGIFESDSDDTRWITGLHRMYLSL